MNDGQIPSNPEDARAYVNVGTPGHCDHNKPSEWLNSELTKDDHIEMLQQKAAALRSSHEHILEENTRHVEDILKLQEENTLLILRLDKALQDVARLDFLEASTKGYGQGWILRESCTGRGMRLHETSMPEAMPTVREAIDVVMEGK